MDSQELYCVWALIAPEAVLNDVKTRSGRTSRMPDRFDISRVTSFAVFCVGFGKFHLKNLVIGFVDFHENNSAIIQLDSTVH